MIGFVGLIVPHIVRGLFGSDHKVTLPLTAVCGALFMVWADLISRILIHNVELPIGIITAMIGAPLFIYIIIKKGIVLGLKMRLSIQNLEIEVAHQSIVRQVYLEVPDKKRSVSLVPMVQANQHC
jgi:hypothetical protein